MTIKEALRSTVKKLEPRIKNPHLEAEILLSTCLKKPRSFVMTYPEHILSKNLLNKLKYFIKERLDDTPLAYLTNTKSFYGLDFYVDKNVLIPRPETELIVDTALDALTLLSKSADEINIIDVGTGSGCIIISIANEIRKLKLKTKYLFYAIDISIEALDIAKKNSKNQNLDDLINFEQGNLLEPILINPDYQKSKTLITANLPYLSNEQIDSSSSIKKEPKLALDGGIKGMELYIKLFKQTSQLKNKIKSEITVLAEIDHTQKDFFITTCQNLLPKATIKVIKDLSGYDRLVVINL